MLSIIWMMSGDGNTRNEKMHDIMRVKNCLFELLHIGMSGENGLSLPIFGCFDFFSLHSLRITSIISSGWKKINRNTIANS